MRTLPALASSLFALALLLGVWLQAQVPSPPEKSTVMIKGVECELTQHPDGSDSISLRNLPPCTAVVRVNAEGDRETRCLSSPEEIETYLNGEEESHLTKK